MDSPTLKMLKACSAELVQSLIGLAFALKEVDSKRLPLSLELVKQIFEPSFEIASEDRTERKSCAALIIENEEAFANAAIEAGLPSNFHGSEHVEGVYWCREIVEKVTKLVDQSQVAKFVKETSSDEGDSEDSMGRALKAIRRGSGFVNAGFVFRDSALKRKLGEVREWLVESRGQSSKVKRLIGRVKREALKLGYSEAIRSNFEMNTTPKRENSTKGKHHGNGKVIQEPTNKGRGRPKLTAEEKADRLQKARKLEAAWKRSGLTRLAYCQKQKLVWKTEKSNAVTKAQSTIRHAKGESA